MTVVIKTGDLLGEDAEAIVNTVNCVGVMGKGIALQFKQKWPENFRAYERACKHDQITPGRMFVYDSGGLVKPHFIINFPTKRHWRGKARIEYITEGLKDLIAQVKKLNIGSIAVPPLGCGNGGLEWDEVRELIVDAFDGLPNVRVLLFEPKGAPAAQKMVIRTKRPRMTPARAAVVMIISIYREMQYGLSKIEIQKLAYLLEQSGEQLNLAFRKHRYGPYSDKLRHVLKAMDGHYILGVGDHAGDADIVAVPDVLNEAKNILESSGGAAAKERITRVAKLIEGFETPYGMELLATVHWVATHEPHASTLDEAITAVHDWSERKRQILQDPHIEIAWHKLADCGWLQSA